MTNDLNYTVTARGNDPPDDDNDDVSTMSLNDEINRRLDRIEKALDDGGDRSSATNCGGAGAGSSTTSSTSATANTRRVAEAHGLPPEWWVLEGIDLPPELTAYDHLSNKALAAAINTAHGERVARPMKVGNARDLAKGRDEYGDRATTGAHVADLHTDNRADGDEGPREPEPSSPAPQNVRNVVERHLSRRGVPVANRGGSDVSETGASLEDVS